MNNKVAALAGAAAVMAVCAGSLKFIDSRDIAVAVSSDGPSKPWGKGGAKPRNGSSQAMAERLSFGERILVEQEENSDAVQPFRDAKAEGVAAMAEGDYAAAADSFEQALSIYPNAPETLIYQNNAEIGDSDSHTVAVVVPLENERKDGSNVSKELLRGVAHRQDEINEAGGINGVPLRVIIADDDGDKAVAPQVAQALVDQGDVMAVIGHFTSDASLAASDIYQEQGLVMMSPTSTSVALSTKGDYIFRSLTSDAFNATALSRHMRQTLGLRKAAIFYNSDSAYSSKLREVFKEKLFVDDGKVVAEYDLFSEDFDAVSSVEDAVAAGAETLILFHNSGVLETALTVIEANEDKLPVLSGDSGYKPEMLTLSDYTAGVLVATVPWNLLGNENSKFARAARDLWGADVSWRTATSYDATQALAKALESADSREGIQAALLDPGFVAEGVADTIEFQSNTGDRDGSPQLVTVARNGKNFILLPD